MTTTDAQLAAQAVAALQKTTISYPAWVKEGKPSSAQWAKALAALQQIGQPTGALLHWFSAASIVNTPIPANAAVDPNTPTWRAQLQASPVVNSIWTNSTDWTTTVALAPAGTETSTPPTARGT